MSEQIRLTEEDIHAWTGDVSYQRGLSYFRDGAITAPTRWGFVLTAKCWGSMPRPYDVWATLSGLGDSIVSASCSCPVGEGGHCKHVAALLLTWINKPEDFAERQELARALQSWSKEDLVALIRKMLARYPDLNDLIELMVLRRSERPLETDQIRARVKKAFAKAGHEWDAPANVARQLVELVLLGNEYSEKGQCFAAATVYQTLIRELLERDDWITDEGGHLHTVIDGCIDGLEVCLTSTDDVERREEMLLTLYRVFAQDVAWGGYGLGEMVPSLICNHATSDERRRVAGWIESAMAKVDSADDRWERTRYGHFLLELLAEDIDDETYLRICRETDQLHALVERLLERQRVDEAMGAVRAAPVYELLPLADTFVVQDYAVQAIALVEERPESARQPDLIQWLKEQARAMGDHSRALALSVSLFRMNPSLSQYGEIRELAEIVGSWNDLRSALLTRLADDKQHAARTEIFLHEGDIDQALDAVAQISDSGHVRERELGLLVRVAQVAETSRPESAIVLYMEVVYALIAARGRYNYEQAAQHLTRVRELYDRLAKQRTWDAVITEIRQGNRPLRALRQELDRAGL